nr:hypothetical protein [Candidatus Sigynarchaeum springense]
MTSACLLFAFSAKPPGCMLDCRHHVSTGARDACWFPRPLVFVGRVKKRRGNYV